MVYPLDLSPGRRWVLAAWAGCRAIGASFSSIHWTVDRLRAKQVAQCVVSATRARDRGHGNSTEQGLTFNGGQTWQHSNAASRRTGRAD